MSSRRTQPTLYPRSYVWGGGGKETKGFDSWREQDVEKINTSYLRIYTTTLYNKIYFYNYNSTTSFDYSWRASIWVIINALDQKYYDVLIWKQIRILSENLDLKGKWYVYCFTR